MELENLWSRAKIGNRSGITYFLVLDGINHLLEEQQTDLFHFLFSSQVVRDGNIRILVSGSNADKLAKHGAAREIKMEDHNYADMQIFVNDTLNKVPELRSAGHLSDQQKARTDIMSKLPQRVNGQYSLLSFALERVMNMLRKRTDIKKLTEMLDQPLTRPEMIVQNLEQSLNLDEIQELNELLKWVVCSPVNMSLDQLEAVWVSPVFFPICCFTLRFNDQQTSILLLAHW